jgi:hypothetical protein
VILAISSSVRSRPPPILSHTTRERGARWDRPVRMGPHP